MKKPMANNIMIYKDDDGKWTTDIRGNRALLSIITVDIIYLKDGTTIVRWHHNSWKEAHEFVFGDKWCATCENAGKVHCGAHITGDGCDEMWWPCPDCKMAA